MADFAIGDIQGCYVPLMRLLEVIHFNEHIDRLWLAGDLVNRGPKSLEVLRFLRSLPVEPIITLGNHDLYLLARLFANLETQYDDTLQTFFQADDKEELGHWLRQQKILHEDPKLNAVMCHAGIAPVWDLSTSKKCAQELESALQGPNYRKFLSLMYGNKPDRWSSALKGLDRLRIITNYFTRMRFCDLQGTLLLDYKGTIDESPPGYIPWYELPGRVEIEPDIIFGHWAALNGKKIPGLFAIDTGCIWGGKLTALRLQDRTFFSVKGQSS